MENYRYGPVEIFVVEFPGDSPDPAVLKTISSLVDVGTVRLLDLVVASRSSDGGVTISELDAVEAASAGVELEAPGLLGDEDIATAASELAPGAGVALVALELSWASELAQNLAAAKGTVTRSERIPANVVNQIINEFSITQS
ncbi:hypothetical protein CVS30_12565 [Arthrobacter psychrolactophilus]|uniref:DUF1269 domain-containing family protein n=1 Tax=Arthrobacter psychrolactophilus TaxID=92442 RepID=A0A2V5JKJ9_9MICC|nr:DUF6325 family protein [Arthrobacter psychrolactophilus]PYI38046.1 hypothetical protein CVS30_12565 [Arthrobacter psychrolactophilus]